MLIPNMTMVVISNLNFEYQCDSYGIKRTPPTNKNPQANAILECMTKS